MSPNRFLQRYARMKRVATGYTVANIYVGVAQRALNRADISTNPKFAEFLRRNAGKTFVSKAYDKSKGAIDLQGKTSHLDSESVTPPMRFSSIQMEFIQLLARNLVQGQYLNDDALNAFGLAEKKYLSSSYDGSLVQMDIDGVVLRFDRVVLKDPCYRLVGQDQNDPDKSETEVKARYSLIESAVEGSGAVYFKPLLVGVSADLWLGQTEPEESPTVTESDPISVEKVRGVLANISRMVIRRFFARVPGMIAKVLGAEVDDVKPLLGQIAGAYYMPSANDLDPVSVYSAMHIKAGLPTTKTKKEVSMGRASVRQQMNRDWTDGTSDRTRDKVPGHRPAARNLVIPLESGRELTLTPREVRFIDENKGEKRENNKLTNLEKFYEYEEFTEEEIRAIKRRFNIQG